MTNKDTFLIEIGTEELPAKAIQTLSETFAHRLEEQLSKENFNFDRTEVFATPRRIAVCIYGVDAVQPDKIIERKGPALNVAIDKNNQPTPAALGFARSCGVNFEALQKKEIEGNTWLVYQYEQKGQHFTDIAPILIDNALKLLSMGRTMRWNASNIEFLRPVHWVVLMYGSQNINAEILGLCAGKNTFGHRFHHPEAILLPNANQYETLLENVGKVIPNFTKRKALILQKIQLLCDQQNAEPVFNESLLDEVAGLVEWPVPYAATYAEDFLALPKEVLISAIEQHQKCFPIKNKDNDELKPCFITISNLESLSPEQIIVGNERVMRARLSDAAFFFYTDKKHSLESRLASLKNVTFQANLGSLFDKATRLSHLSSWIAAQWKSKTTPIKNVERAGLLAKTDLVTNMVNEFPELQGMMGYYYAQHDGETDDVALAIREHHLPRGAGDALPTSLAGCALAIADRIDTIVGIFSLGQIPTGDKDPFALKRAAIGILRILIERELSLSLDALIMETIKGYMDPALKVRDNNRNTDNSENTKVKDFIIERLRAWYSEKGISSDTFNAVLASQDDEFLDIHHRIIAVERFRQLAEAQTLTSANKRISNILQQAEFSLKNDLKEPDPHLFETDAEKNLYHQIKQLKKNDKIARDYTVRLTEFAALNTAVNHFFDVVMVMVPDERQRNNRLQLLANLRYLFLQIADISILQL